MSVRPFSPDDREQLIGLWQTVFGDSREFITEFLDCVVRPGRGMVMEEADQIVAAAYIIDGIRFSERPTPYIYAVSTLPAYRGKGYGAVVTAACAAEIEAEGGIAALHPAESGLFDWYARQNFLPFCTVRETVMAPIGAESALLTRLSAEEYLRLRRFMLRQAPAANFEPQLLDWWARWSNGVFYGYDGGCLCICRSGDALFIPELLSRQNADAALSAVARNQKVLVRTPTLSGFEGFGPEKAFISARGTFPSPGYWGFAFE